MNFRAKPTVRLKKVAGLVKPRLCICAVGWLGCCLCRKVQPLFSCPVGHSLSLANDYFKFGQRPDDLLKAGMNPVYHVGLGGSRSCVPIRSGQHVFPVLGQATPASVGSRPGNRRIIPEQLTGSTRPSAWRRSHISTESPGLDCWEKATARSSDLRLRSPMTGAGNAMAMSSAVCRQTSGVLWQPWD